MLEEKSMFDKSKVDLDFAEKLRKESPNQYNTLITMHLSFLLDITVNEWVLTTIWRKLINFCWLRIKEKVNFFNSSEQDNNDKVKAKKHWLFTMNKKKPASICTSNSNVKSPDCPILTADLIKQLIFLMKFLEKDESE